MPDRRDLATVLRAAVEDVQAPASLLADVRAKGRRRVAVRRARALGVTALAATVAVAVLTSTAPGGGTEETLQPAAPSATPSPAGSRVPDLVGMTHDEVELVLKGIRTRRGSINQFAVLRSVAADEASEGTVLSQDPSAGTVRLDERAPITLTFSAGGPAVPLEQVPVAAAVRLRQAGLLPGERVLLAETAAGSVFKTDAMLTGPCAAVRLAYRTFRDPQYENSCW